jgi:hypothetical protein
LFFADRFRPELAPSAGAANMPSRSVKLKPHKLKQLTRA